MPEFQLYPELAARLQAIYDSPSGQGMLRLFEIIKEAKDDPKISNSVPAMEVVDLLIELLGDAISARSVDDVLDPLLSAENSIRQSERGKKSGRPLTKDYVVKQFLSSSSLWSSIGEAVEAIKPAAMDFAIKNERAFAPTNASREIRSWLSTLLSSSNEAQMKLTQQGRNRLRKAT